jgi:hypothetical protein
MGRFITTIANMNHNLTIEEVRLVKGVKAVSFRGKKLTAKIAEVTNRDECEELAKQLRLVFAFAYRSVYSESYQLSTDSTGYHFTGQDDRKSHLLEKNYNFAPKYLSNADLLFVDLLQTEAPKQNATKLFNMLYIWNRAHELRLLHLPLEAQVILGKIVDDMNRPGMDFKAGKLIRGLGIIQTESDKFAANLLQAYGRQKLISAKAELDGFSYLNRLYRRQSESFSPETAYYVGNKIQTELERKNAFLFEITRLYILWEFGLQNYYLLQNASLYKVERKKTAANKSII